MKKIINIIASFRNESESINHFCKKIDNAFKKNKNVDYKIYFINDFSTDNSEKKIIKLKKKNSKIFLFSTNKNYGGSPSIHYGFDVIPSNEFATVIDCDLQDPPELLVKELELTNKETLVNFVRLERDEGTFQLLYTMIAYKFISLISNKKIIENSNYFKIIPPYIVKKIKNSKELNPYWNYFISQFAKKNKIVLYKRKKRLYGTSKFNFFSINPWATFYSALYYFKLKSYCAFLLLFFLSFIVFISYKDNSFVKTSLIFFMLIQLINLFLFTISNLRKLLLSRQKIKAKTFN